MSVAFSTAPERGCGPTCVQQPVIVDDLPSHLLARGALHTHTALKQVRHGAWQHGQAGRQAGIKTQVV